MLLRPTGKWEYAQASLHNTVSSLPFPHLFVHSSCRSVSSSSSIFLHSPPFVYQLRKLPHNSSSTTQLTILAPAPLAQRLSRQERLPDRPLQSNCGV